uniref:Uncharacterized protein n=1 Tax=uncultured bacterium 4C6 TaxID=1701323 RepID=A0A0N7F2A6_9BACT|nr:hypothetical protein [uncultured bacterium 4C6]
MLLLAILPFLQAYAQKLPKVQTASLPAPANIKIDGKAAEWNGLQAYDPNNMLYYSLANDQNNLYLVIKSDKNTISRKILLGGFKFNLQAGGEAEKTITYPVVNDTNIRSIYNRFPTGNQQIDYTEAYKRSYKEILKLFKTLGVKGFKNIENTETPIYNDLDIWVNAAFDETGAYVCEFAIPLKYLINGAVNTERLTYTLTIGRAKMPDGDGRPIEIKTHDGGPPLDNQGVDLRTMHSDTFLKAEYTLAK